MDLEQSNFLIKAYGFGELAQMYLPDIKSRSASARLSIWINHNPHLQKALDHAGYRKGMKVLTPRMVHSIIDSLGYPK
ncbi:unnamed protein product [Chrysoparadoxa australica]